MTAPELSDVSRETIQRLEHYAVLLKKWNSSINLVSKASLEQIWTRHIIDSAQVFQIPNHPIEHWVDLGVGGGFPGLVVAIMAMESDSPQRTTLVESDVRKCTFLRTVLRETGVKADVLNARIEKLPYLNADIISARALADLSMLLSFTEQHLHRGGTALFLKGKTWKKEVESAQSKWNFDCEVVKSKTEIGAVILRITGASRV